MNLGPRHKTNAMLRTIIVFGVLFLILIWVKMRIPNPPYPEGGGGPGMGLEVNLGASNEGMGDEQMLDPINMPDFKEAKATPTLEVDEKLITDESDESETIDASEKKEKVVEKKTDVKIKKKEEKRKPEKENNLNNAEVSTPKINQKALFPAKKNTGNEGITGKAGDQGSANGVSGSPLYTGGGNGSGGGTGGGSGTGNGTNAGDGVSFSLNGRSPSYLPKPEFNEQKEGKVVVEITVDKNGKVISAIPGVKGSTTLDDDLLDAAKKAALLSKFDKKLSATVQKGTITYHFLLQ